MPSRVNERADLARVIHHTGRQRFNGYGWPGCGQGGTPCANVTTDPAKVTCKKCRKRLGLAVS